MIAKRLFLFALVAVFSVTVAVAQDTDTASADVPPELHVAGVSKGAIRTGDRIHGPEATVSVIRPGKDVHLALGSRSATRFLVTLDSETTMSSVVLFGKNASASEVYVNGEPFEDVKVLEKSRMVFVQRGLEFRRLLRRLTTMSNTTGLSSFQSRSAKDKPNVVIDSIEDAPELQAVYLPPFIDRSGLTDTLLPYLSDTPPAPDVVFDSKGFALGQGDALTRIPVTLDVPGISHPVAAAFDKAGQRIFGVTLGGEGFLYQYDMITEKWSILTSMDNMDATGMVYDPGNGRLILAHNGRSVHKGRLLEWTLEGGIQPLNLGITVGDMKGLTDLMEHGNTALPTFIPTAFENGKLLVRTFSPGVHIRNGQPTRQREQPRRTRTYLFDVEDRTVDLVDYTWD